MSLYDFMRESNAIEGIHREVTREEMAAAERVMSLMQVHAVTLGDFQAVIAPGKPLREREDMNVRVGYHIAPRGGPTIVRRLNAICRRANKGEENPWKVHIAFETLHPYLDGNGRTGRILWAWNMRQIGQNPFALSFLHRWYYQTLAGVRR